MNTNPVFFYSAKSDSEAEIILSKLKACGIEAFIKRDDLGATSKLYTGKSVTGADIYVPYCALADANNILLINEADLPPFEGRNPAKSTYSDGFVKKSLILCGVIAVLIAAIYIVSKFI